MLVLPQSPTSKTQKGNVARDGSLGGWVLGVEPPQEWAWCPLKHDLPLSEGTPERGH